MKVFKNLYRRILGTLIYVVSVDSIYGERNILLYTDIKMVNSLVNELNEEDQYSYMISKIEKKRVYPFTYTNPVKHTRLTFTKDGLTEMVYSEKDDYYYSFLIVDKSLTNVVRKN